MAVTIATHPKAVNFSRDPIYLQVESDLFDAIGPPYLPLEINHSCAMQLWQVTDSGDVYIAPISVPYSSTTKLATIDLSGLMDFIDVPLPADVFDNDTIVRQPDQGGIATVYIKYGDAFGSPATSLLTQQTGQIKVIRGASKYWFGFGPDAQLRPLYLLHSYKHFDRSKFKRFGKTISKSQEEIIYLYNHNTSAVVITVTWQAKDGSNGNYDIVPLTLPDGISYISVSYDAIEIESKSGHTDIVSYQLSFQTSPTPGSKVQSIDYLIDQSPNAYEWTFLYDNGCGGMETIRMSGRHKQGVNVTKGTYSAPRWRGSDFRKGQARSFDHRGGEVLEVNTGYYDKAYIDHLQQILYSDIWLLHEAKKRLIRYQVLTTDALPIDDTEMLYNLTLTLTPSTIETSHNTFNL